VEVDYSALPEERKEMAVRTRVFDTKASEAEYEEKIADVSRQMVGLNPNMRAVEQYEAEEGRLRDIKQQADEATAESLRLSRAFETVKAERITRFMECFKYVESCVHPFYRDLTSYDGYEGGSAYLDLDDAEEPYNGGITFTACPPGKRFFPMELLSGGERSMASMALLFAMHSFKPPPFMILDEVDAPFDRKNTNSLVAYLKKLDFQCLVISLKDSFFSHSDSIVGIFKDKQIQSSGSLSLPLKKLFEECETQEAPEATPVSYPAGRALAPETEVPHAEALGEQDDEDID
jgi:structural maintenance of chromosome 1